MPKLWRIIRKENKYVPQGKSFFGWKSLYDVFPLFCGDDVYIESRYDNEQKAREAIREYVLKNSKKGKNIVALLTTEQILSSIN